MGPQGHGELVLDLCFEVGDALCASTSDHPLLFLGIHHYDMEDQMAGWTGDLESLWIRVTPVDNPGPKRIHLHQITDVIRCRDGYHRSKWTVCVSGVWWTPSLVAT